MSDKEKDVVVEAHVHALEKRERNGKWKTRGLEMLPEKTADSPINSDFRYKYLITGKGASLDEAAADAFQRLSASPDLRSYMLHAIRAV